MKNNYQYIYILSVSKVDQISYFFYFAISNLELDISFRVSLMEYSQNWCCLKYKLKEARYLFFAKVNIYSIFLKTVFSQNTKLCIKKYFQTAFLTRKRGHFSSFLNTVCQTIGHYNNMEFNAGVLKR